GRGGGGGPPVVHHVPGRGAPVRLNHEHRERISDHRPDAQDVQAAGAEQDVKGLLDSLQATKFAYLIAGGLFILSLYWMNSPLTARRGVLAGVIAMVLAVLGAAVDPH